MFKWYTWWASPHTFAYGDAHFLSMPNLHNRSCQKRWDIHTMASSLACGWLTGNQLCAIRIIELHIYWLSAGVYLKKKQLRRFIYLLCMCCCPVIIHINWFINTFTQSFCSWLWKDICYILILWSLLRISVGAGIEIQYSNSKFSKQTFQAPIIIEVFILVKTNRSQHFYLLLTDYFERLQYQLSF